MECCIIILFSILVLLYTSIVDISSTKYWCNLTK